MYDWRPTEAGSLTLVYKVLGQGTEALRHLAPGAELDVLTGLGNGFDIDNVDAVRRTQAPLLLGRRVGVPPLYGLARRLLAIGKAPVAVLGFNNAADLILRADFRGAGHPHAHRHRGWQRGREGLCDRCGRGAGWAV